MIKLNPGNIAILKKEDIEKYFGQLEFIEGGYDVVKEFFEDLLEVDKRLEETVKKNINPAYDVIIEFNFDAENEEDMGKIGLAADQRYRIKISERRMFEAYAEKEFSNFVFLQDRINEKL